MLITFTICRWGLQDGTLYRVWIAALHHNSASRHRSVCCWYCARGTLASPRKYGLVPVCVLFSGGRKASVVVFGMIPYGCWRFSHWPSSSWVSFSSDGFVGCVDCVGDFLLCLAFCCCWWIYYLCWRLASCIAVPMCWCLCYRLSLLYLNRPTCPCESFIRNKLGKQFCLVSFGLWNECNRVRWLALRNLRATLDIF